MILPDANILLYAVDRSAPRYEPARSWLQAVLVGAESVGFAWSVLLAVIRISTSPTVFEQPLTADQALDLVDGWLRLPIAVTLTPTQRHLAVMRGLLDPLGTAGNLVPDAHLAALAIEHGGSVASADHDFGRFPGLRWFDPLA